MSLTGSLMEKGVGVAIQKLEEARERHPEEIARETAGYLLALAERIANEPDIPDYLKDVTVRALLAWSEEPSLTLTLVLAGLRELKEKAK